MLGEASPVNIVLKLNQLTSLLSSIEEKVEFSSYFISSSCPPLPLVGFLFIISAVLCCSKIVLFSFHSSQCNAESQNAINYT